MEALEVNEECNNIQIIVFSKMNDIQDYFDVFVHLSNLVDEQREENKVYNRDFEHLVNWITCMQTTKVSMSFKYWKFVFDEVTWMIEKGKKICGGFWPKNDSMLEGMRMQTF